MKTRLIKTLTEYIKDNKRQYAVVIAALLIGTVLGSFSATMLDSGQFESLSSYTDNFISSYNLQPISKTGVFLSSVIANIKTVFFLWLSGLWVGLIPFTLFQTGVKGYKLGFSTAFLVSAYNGKGLVFAILSMLPQVLIFLPALTVYAVFSIKYSISVKRLRHSTSSQLRKDMYFRNALCTLGILIVMVICSLCDAYVIPPVLKPVCSYLAI